MTAIPTSPTGAPSPFWVQDVGEFSIVPLLIELSGMQLRN
jgi:hypothetical protein